MERSLVIVRMSLAMWSTGHAAPGGGALNMATSRAMPRLWALDGPV
jgi:hypothetical protein